MSANTSFENFNNFKIFVQSLTKSQILFNHFQIFSAPYFPRFHLKKGTMNVHTLLQKMFQNELTEAELSQDMSSIVTAQVTN